MVRPELAAPPGVPVAPPNIPSATGTPSGDSAWLLGVASPIVVFLFLWRGHGLLDRPDPATGAAGAIYALGVAAAAASCWLLLRRQQVRWPLAAAAVAAVPLGLWVAHLARGYGLGVFVTYHYFLYSVVPLWVMSLVAATIAHVAGSPSTGRRAIAAAGAGFCGALGLAMLLHLVTIKQQAQAAREAHDIPGLGLLWLLLALFALARRR